MLCNFLINIFFELDSFFFPLEERRAKKRESAAKAKVSPPSSSVKKKEKGREENEDEEAETRQPTGEELLWSRLDELERQEEELDEMA